MAKRRKKKKVRTPAQRLRERYKKRTEDIHVEHRDSWGDELRCNATQRALAEATAMSRSWLITISVYYDGYIDRYHYEFQDCCLCDDKSIQKFEVLRDHILSVELDKANPKHYMDWGWEGTPWENRFSYVDPEDEILVANFKKEETND